jgi:hypothetical protein
MLGVVLASQALTSFCCDTACSLASTLLLLGTPLQCNIMRDTGQVVTYHKCEWEEHMTRSHINPNAELGGDLVHCTT